VPITASGVWLVPADWNNTSNTVYCIGAGGGCITTSSGAGGGGGGACVFTSTLVLTPGALVTVQVGVGNGTTGSGTAPTANTWFNSSALVAAGGATTNASNTGGAAGSTANSAGGTKYAGGVGGTYSSGTYAGAGGGAAGL